MKAKLIFACLSLALFAPAAQAAIVSIDDISEGLALYVNAFDRITHPGDFPPGSGNPIDITTPTNSNGISDIVYNPALETLSFTFANQIPWGSDVYFYRYFTGPYEGLSDLFVIQGLGGQNPDYITFISDPGRLTSSSGNITDVVPLLPNSTATPINLGAMTEGGWQLAYDTSVDQYYIRSDVTTPEPTTLAVFGAGIAAMACVSLRARRNKRV